MEMENMLENWIAPLSLKDFENRYLHQKLFHARSSKNQKIITWESLNTLLNQRSIWSVETLKLYLHTRSIPREKYCVPVSDAQGHAILRPHPPLVQNWISQGASLVLNDIGTLTPELTKMLHTLQTLFGARVQTNLYASMQGVQAFASHFDLHDVFVFQAEGEKEWRIYAHRVDAPINHPAFNLLTQEHHEQTKGPLLKQLTLKAGDFLYLPRGFYHDALASKGPSLHVTFGVTRPIGLDIVSLLFEEGIHHAALRRYLTPSSLAKDCHALAAYISDIMKHPDFVQKAHKLFTVGDGDACFPYSFPCVKRVSPFKVRGKGLSIEHHSDQFWLVSATTEVPIPPGKEKLVSWILGQNEATFEELTRSHPDVSREAWETVVKDLVQMGILE